MAIANVLITSLPEATSPSANDYLILQGKNTQRIKWSALLDKIYPVGCIYQSVSSTSPASFLGGTWEQIKDRFILAAGDTYAAGSTGGEAAHALTVEEGPKHTHVETTTDSLGIKNEMKGAPKGSSTPGVLLYGNFVDNCGASLRTLESGNGRPHNNMPPYLTAYIWRRIA